jgi:hypothetical protein
MGFAAVPERIIDRATAKLAGIILPRLGVGG